jgi:hypothetical protein
LLQTLQRAGASMYQSQTPPPPPPGGETGGGGREEDVVEGEFREA